MNLTRLTVAKAVANTALRWVPPFLPTLERAFGASTQQLTTVIGAGEIAGLSTLGVARHLDRGRSRLVMSAALAVVSLASLVALVGTTATFAIGFVLVVVGVSNLTVAGHAHISHQVPYAGRGRAIGVYETSWAFALLVGAPVVAGLIAWVGWRGPFAALALATAVLAAVIARSPSDPSGSADASAPDDPTGAPRPQGPAGPAGGASPAPAPAPVPAGATAPRTAAPPAEAIAIPGRFTSLPARAWAVVAGSALLAMAGLSLFAVSGSWLDGAFGLSTGGLGAAAMAYGAIELGASSGSAVIADRLGKLRATLAGITALVVGLAIISIADDLLWVGLAGMLTFVGGFEFAFVTSLSLVTEATPRTRGTTIALASAVGTLARGCGTIASGVLFGIHGVRGPVVLSATAATCAAACFALSRRAPS
ncbi:MFS transporter [Ilumatobacter sp.]|uniref:MFS transporter n=1 Tax=Ilumatobacter sp. TaxID=1967498 RepID=UPI003B516E9A